MHIIIIITDYCKKKNYDSICESQESGGGLVAFATSAAVYVANPALTSGLQI